MNNDIRPSWWDKYPFEAMGGVTNNYHYFNHPDRQPLVYINQ